MRLLSVKGNLFPDVPIDLYFDPHFVPDIFVIGGMQGCGKTTLFKKLVRGNRCDFSAIYDENNVGSVFLGADYFNSAEDDIDPAYTLRYAWKNGGEKYKQIISWVAGLPNKSVILLDNPDTELHPDNQFQLVLDLEKVKGDSQIIIATHSYELCTALTPSHIHIIKTPIEIAAELRKK